MASGVQVKDECVTEYEKIKMGKTYSYIIYKISDCKKFIEVDCTGDKGAAYEEFQQKLMEAGNKGEGRYGLFDVQTNVKGVSKGVLAFVMWLPDNTLSIKQKMLYTSSKKAIREKFQGIGAELQCNDEDDLSYACIAEKCQSRYT